VRCRHTLTLWRAGGRVLAGAALVLGITPIGATAAPVPQASVRMTPDVDALQQEADALRERLQRLQGEADWTRERLAYARDRLAEATTSAITADEQLQTLQGYTTQATLDLAHRVRAIEQSGGVSALYTQALDADEITDVTSNVAALNAVLTLGIVGVADAAAARDQQLVVHRRLDRTASERARLMTRIKGLSEQRDDLVAEQRQLVRQADAAVARAMRQLARQQQQDAVTTWTGPIPSGPTAYSSRAVEAALSVLGSPYVWGAEGPDTFDCSGLVQWSYLQAGLLLPRLASDQYRASTPVPFDQMQPGDLIVYAYDVHDESTIHHITMYLGNGQMVHAPHTGDVVKVVPVYTEGIYGTVRPGL
jgi:cell wall-associated NlpC family hydrolase